MSLAVETTGKASCRSLLPWLPPKAEVRLPALTLHYLRADNRNLTPVGAGVLEGAGGLHDLFTTLFGQQKGVNRWANFSVVPTTMLLPVPIFKALLPKRRARSICPSLPDHHHHRSGLDIFCRTLPPASSFMANDLGFTEPTIAAMLGHASGTVTGRYIHNLDPALIAAADRVARRIDSLMSGIEANIIELATARRAGC